MRTLFLSLALVNFLCAALTGSMVNLSIAFSMTTMGLFVVGGKSSK